MDAFLRPGTRNRQMALSAGSIIVMAICGTLLAACAAAPNRLNVGAAVSDSELVTSPYQTGELHLVLMPPDALMGGIAEARR
jgi:hypothetical protein